MQVANVLSVQTSSVRVSQNFCIPSCNSCKFEGFCKVQRNCLSDPQTFSIGLRSGDCRSLPPIAIEELSNVFRGMLGIIILLKSRPVRKTAL